MLTVRELSDRRRLCTLYKDLARASICREYARPISESWSQRGSGTVILTRHPTSSCIPAMLSKSWYTSSTAFQSCLTMEVGGSGMHCRRQVETSTKKVCAVGDGSYADTRLTSGACLRECKNDKSRFQSAKSCRFDSPCASLDDSRAPTPTAHQVRSVRMSTRETAPLPRSRMGQTC